MGEATLFCGNLAPKVTDEILYELFLQAGPIEKVSIPKDKDGNSRQFGFVTFKHDVSVPYAIELMSEETLFGRPLQVKSRSGKGAESPSVGIPGTSTQSTPRQTQRRHDDHHDRDRREGHRNGLGNDHRSSLSNDQDSRRRSVDSQPYRSRQGYGGVASSSVPVTPTSVWNSQPLFPLPYGQNQSRHFAGQSPQFFDPVLEERLRIMQQRQAIQQAYSGRGHTQAFWQNERRY